MTTAAATAAAGLVPVSEVDYLEQDPPIRGQRYACLSVIQPTEVIKRKDVWIFQQFLEGISGEMRELWDSMIALHKESNPELVDSLRKIEDRYDYLFDAAKVHDAYDFYRSSHRERLEAAYLEKNSFQTTIAGIKIRGSYESLREAQIRAEVLKRKDPQHNVYVGEVGCWLPLDPDPAQIENQEFAETQLNTLMKGYTENQAAKDAYYESRKDALCEQAQEVNEIRKKKIREELLLQAASASVSVAEEEEGVVAEAAPAPVSVSEDDDPWMARKRAEADAAAVDAAAAASPEEEGKSPDEGRGV